MVAAVQNEDRAWHRQRARSSASGPPFSVPLLPVQPGSTWLGPAAMVGIAPQIVMVPGVGAAPPGAAPVGVAPLGAGAGPGLGLSDLSQFLGRRVGSGQCVALVQAVQPEVGPTRNWTCGEWVQGNARLQPGTPIATFDPSSRYANATDGSSHAAIYLGQSAEGIQVLDQWASKEAAVRTIPWSNPSGVAANTGTAYRVINSP